MKRTPLLGLLLIVGLVLGPWPAVACPGCAGCSGAACPMAASSCHEPAPSLTGAAECCSVAEGGMPATPARAHGCLGPTATAVPVGGVHLDAPAPRSLAREPARPIERALDRCTLFSSLLI